MTKRTLFVAQLLITFMMAFSMSGIMGLISAGPAFLPHWPISGLMAWPVAFVLTQIVTPIAFGLAKMLSPAKSDGA